MLHPADPGGARSPVQELQGLHKLGPGPLRLHLDGEAIRVVSDVPRQPQVAGVAADEVPKPNALDHPVNRGREAGGFVLQTQGPTRSQKRVSCGGLLISARPLHPLLRTRLVSAWE